MRPYWSGGGVELYLGDCLEILPGLDGVDHAITDPPFEFEAHTLQRRVKRPAPGLNDRVTKIESIGFAAIDEATREGVSKEIARLSKRWALVFCQVEAANRWAETLQPMNYRRTCIWVKPDGQPQLSGDRPAMGYETIVASHAPGRSKWNGGGRSSVFTFNKNSGGKHDHPTQKPIPLMAELVRLFTDSGETILDPFSGSGSTLIAAWRQHRKAIGVEMNEGYCELIARRMEAEMSQGRMSFSPAAEQASLL